MTGAEIVILLANIMLLYLNKYKNHQHKIQIPMTNLYMQKSSGMLTIRDNRGLCFRKMFSFCLQTIFFFGGTIEFFWN